MTPLSEREQFILGAVVREYVKQAQPVGSTVISQKFGLDFSPATIRNDMQELEEKGYLFQPHTSAGRVPTDAGYRFYVNHLLNARELDRAHERQHERDVERELKVLQAKYHIVSQLLTRALAQLTEHVVVDVHASRKSQDPSVTHSGFSYLLREPEFQDPKKAYEVAEVLDHLDELVHRIALPHDNARIGEITVSIGAENPLENLKSCSMITAQYELPNHQQGTIVILGPTRMNYESNMKTLEAIAKIASSGGILVLAIALFIH